MKINNYIISILVYCLIVFTTTTNGLNENTGVVEGYYWIAGDAVNGQYGSYSFLDRIKLINMMSTNNLGVYWYCPQNVDTNKMWSTQLLNEWTQVAALASTKGITVVYGIRPGWLNIEVFPDILSRVKQIASSGIKYYSINFDDSEGVSTTAQQQKEVQLIKYLETNIPTMKIYSILPYAYFQEPTFNTKTKWSNALSTLDQVSPSIPFVFTGTIISPQYMQTSQFPTLPSSRPLKYFDNWIAVDTNTKIAWGPINNRVDQSIFNEPYGYFLNLGFPLERVPHHIYCLGKMASGSQVCDITEAATVWAEYLNDYGFLHGKSVSSTITSLANGINQDNSYDTIVQMEQDLGLQGIFSTPPTSNQP